MTATLYGYHSDFSKKKIKKGGGVYLKLANNTRKKLEVEHGKKTLKHDQTDNFELSELYTFNLSDNSVRSVINFLVSNSKL